MTVKCPHCATASYVRAHLSMLGRDPAGTWCVRFWFCPACHKLVVYLECTATEADSTTSIMVYPLSINRAVPEVVPESFAADFREACAVWALSPKASAALSRRCLQALLVDKGGATPDAPLSKQIDEVIGSLPTHIAGYLHMFREIGNLASHVTKDSSTGQIVDVEPGEAECLLDLLEAMFDHYFVRPSQLTARKAALNEKLKAAGRKPFE